MLNEMARLEAEANIARDTLMIHLQELLLLFTHLAEEYHIARTPSYSKFYQRWIKKYIRQESDDTLPVLPYEILLNRLEKNTYLIHNEISKISTIQNNINNSTPVGK